MLEYIDKAALMSRIESQAREWGEEYDAEQILGDIEDFPAADVKPVVRGEWIEKPFLLGTSRFCSECGNNYGMPHEIYNYCPNCGADTRKEGDDA